MADTDEAMEEAPAPPAAAPDDAEPPAPRGAEDFANAIVSKAAENKLESADRDAERAEAKWRSLGSGAQLGDGSDAAPRAAPREPPLDVRVTFFADGFCVEAGNRDEAPPAAAPAPRRSGLATLGDESRRARPTPNLPELRPFDSDEARAFLGAVERDEVPTAILEDLAPGARRVRFLVEDARPMPCPWGPGSPLEGALRAARQERRAAPAAPASFQGAGQTLGGSASAEPAAEEAALPAAPVVDAAQPTVTFRVRCADRTQLTATLNATHTVGHVRAFLAAAGKGGAPYDLLAGFPPKPLGDAAASVDGLNGEAVQQKLRK